MSKWVTRYAASSALHWSRNRETPAAAMFAVYGYAEEAKAHVLAKYELLDGDMDNDRVYFDNFRPRLDESDSATCRNLEIIAVDPQHWQPWDPADPIEDITVTHGRLVGEIIAMVRKQYEDEDED